MLTLTFESLSLLYVDFNSKPTRCTDSVRTSWRLLGRCPKTLKAGTNKMARIEIRISTEDKKELKAKAENAGVSVSELIKQSVKRVRTFTIADKSIELQKLKELNRIGNNLNQIARWCNVHKSDAEAVDVIKHLVAIEKAINNDD